MSSVRLYIGGLPPDVKKDELVRRLTAFGVAASDVEDKWLHRGMAYVTAPDEASSQRLIHTLSNIKWAAGFKLKIQKPREKYYTKLMKRIDEYRNKEEAVQLQIAADRRARANAARPVFNEAKPLTLRKPGTLGGTVTAKVNRKTFRTFFPQIAAKSIDEVWHTAAIEPEEPRERKRARSPDLPAGEVPVNIWKPSDPAAVTNTAAVTPVESTAITPMVVPVIVPATIKPKADDPVAPVKKEASSKPAKLVANLLELFQPVAKAAKPAAAPSKVKQQKQPAAPVQKSAPSPKKPRVAAVKQFVKPDDFLPSRPGLAGTDLSRFASSSDDDDDDNPVPNASSVRNVMSFAADNADKAVTMMDTIPTSVDVVQPAVTVASASEALPAQSNENENVNVKEAAPAVVAVAAPAVVTTAPPQTVTVIRLTSTLPPPLFG
eukprot:TRINITY_DN775_c0_g1_i1.p1 TRINITY_DN775_c0_g1~~TRINITY_DN775_c0_g1_i1.p1  ORF type:complete len:434 (+),score=96.60 TRINITY_DN775_c0_g1_i1:51-1352(+)